MSIAAPRSDRHPRGHATRSPPLEDRNLFARQRRRSSRRSSARAAAGRASARRRPGAFWGGEPQEWGRLANENPPVLQTHDRFGNRIDEVEFHPAWHQLMDAGVERRAARAAVERATAARRARRARGDLHERHAGRGRLRLPDHDDLRGGPRAARDARAGRRVGAAPDRPTSYDGALRPRARRRPARIVRHGDDREAGRLGRARQHDASPTPLAATASTRSSGHKWFCSAPMCDLFLVLAQTDEGVSCFAVPRFLPDGTRNAVPAPAPQGQARQPLQRVARRSSSTAPGRSGSASPGRGVPDDHRDGRPHAAGLRDRHGRRACARRSRRRRGTRRTAARSASCSPTSR